MFTGVRMPPSSTSMVYTWSIESVLIGLVALALVDDYLAIAQLALALITLVLHLFCSATTLDGYYPVAVSYLCTLSGMLLAAGVRPLDTMAPIVTVAILGVAELAALGMVFASTTGGTALFFHPRGHFALMVCVLLEVVKCSSLNLLGISGTELALTASFSVVSMQLNPFDTISLVFGILSGGGFSAMFFLIDKSVPAYIAAIVGGLSLICLVGVWVPVWIVSLVPDLSLKDLSLSGIKLSDLPSFKLGGLTIEPGPWLITFFLVLFALGCVGFGLWQVIGGNLTFLGIVIVPFVFIALSIVILWVYRAANPAPKEENTQPSAPLLPTFHMHWPRVKLPRKQV